MKNIHKQLMIPMLILLGIITLLLVIVTVVEGLSILGLIIQAANNGQDISGEFFYYVGYLLREDIYVDFAIVAIIMVALTSKFKPLSIVTLVFAIMFNCYIASQFISNLTIPLYIVLYALLLLLSIPLLPLAIVDFIKLGIFKKENVEKEPKVELIEEK